jgi:hypothetical protein
VLAIHCSQVIVVLIVNKLVSIAKKSELKKNTRDVDASRALAVSAVSFVGGTTEVADSGGGGRMAMRSPSLAVVAPRWPALAAVVTT